MIRPLAILVALGGLAGTAAAQSVTIFGLLDLSVQHLRSGDSSALAGQHMTRLSDGTTYGPGSRWGIRLSEDLGGGLIARVHMENGFNADTGTLAQGGRAFGRQVYVALGSASAGELRLGRQYMFHDETLAVMNPSQGTTGLNPGGIYTLKTGVFNPILSAPRIDNAIQYVSPTFGGFRAQAMVALGEGTADRYQALKGTYAGGPLNVAVAYEQSKALAPASGKTTVNKVFAVGANYDFGVARLWGGYERGKDLTTGVGTQIGTLSFPGLPGPATELKAYTVGVSKAVGAADVMALYARSTFSSASGADASIDRYGAGVTYSLSKLTSIYGVVALAGGDLKNHVNEKQLYQLGLRKAF